MFQILLQEYECICLLLKVEYECICLLLKVITTLADAPTAIEKKGPVQLACVHGSQYEHFYVINFYVHTSSGLAAISIPSIIATITSKTSIK